MASRLSANNVPRAKNYVAKLPTELLSEIFSSVVPKPRDWEGFREARRILYSVDRQWRNVAHFTPWLWTSFPITPATSFTFVTSSFERTKNFPLSISLHLALWNAGVRTAKDVLSDVFPFLVARFARIERLAIDCQLSDWDSITAQLQTANTEGLRRFSVSFNLPYGLLNDTPYSPTFSGPFYNGSRLLELNVQNAPACWGDTRVFGFLVRLRLADLGRHTQVSWTNLAAALNSTTCLEVLEISRVECAHTDTLQRVLLPFVKEFTVKYERAQTIDVVSLLELPNVESIDITSFFAEGLDLLVERLQTLLQIPVHAHLLLSGCNAADFGRLINAMPELTTLDITGCNFFLAQSILDIFNLQPFKIRKVLEFKTSAALRESDVNLVLSSHAPAERIVIARHTSDVKSTYRIWSKSSGRLLSRFADFQYSDPSIVTEWCYR